MAINNQLVPITLSSLKAALIAEGLSFVGLSLKPPDEKNFRRLQEWRSLGFAADMKFMLTESETFKDPFQLHPKSSAIISFLLPYSTTPRLLPVPGVGLIARYAWGRDYHNVIRRAANRLKRRLSALVGDVMLHVHSDAAPILERPLALDGGGFIGKNSMLIRPGEGSFFVIGEVFLENPLDLDVETPLARRASCGTCSRCISSCPTGAIVSPGVVDARSCISYLTIEHRGRFDLQQLKMLGNWVFGCDICQECCPFNHRALKSSPSISALSPSEMLKGGVISLDDILSFASDRAFADRFQGTPLMRPGREGLIRNACAVAVNTGYTALRARLEERARSDSNPLVVECCENALSALFH
jgi:epoxyqueuosine reductase